MDSNFRFRVRNLGIQFVKTEEGDEIEAGLRIILRGADLEPRVCADPMLIRTGPKPLSRPRRQWSSTPLYRGI